MKTIQLLFVDPHGQLITHFVQAPPGDGNSLNLPVNLRVIQVWVIDGGGQAMVFRQWGLRLFFAPDDEQLEAILVKAQDEMDHPPETLSVVEWTPPLGDGELQIRAEWLAPGAVSPSGGLNVDAEGWALFPEPQFEHTPSEVGALTLPVGTPPVWLAGLGALGLGGGGGGGGGALALPSDGAGGGLSTVLTTIGGRVVLGMPTGGLVVAIYNAQGERLGSAEVQVDGSYQTEVVVNGPVILVIEDVNGEAVNFIDEGVGGPRDLDRSILTVGEVQAGQPTTLNLNHLTTLAAYLSGVRVTGADSGQTVLNLDAFDANNVLQINQQVAQWLGLAGENISQVAVTPVMDEQGNPVDAATLNTASMLEALFSVVVSMSTAETLDQGLQALAEQVKRQQSLPPAEVQHWQKAAQSLNDQYNLGLQSLVKVVNQLTTPVSRVQADTLTPVTGDDWVSEDEWAQGFVLSGTYDPASWSGDLWVSMSPLVANGDIDTSAASTWQAELDANAKTWQVRVPGLSDLGHRTYAMALMRTDETVLDSRLVVVNAVPMPQWDLQTDTVLFVESTPGSLAAGEPSMVSLADLGASLATTGKLPDCVALKWVMHDGDAADQLWLQTNQGNQALSLSSSGAASFTLANGLLVHVAMTIEGNDWVFTFTSDAPSPATTWLGLLDALGFDHLGNQPVMHDRHFSLWLTDVYGRTLTTDGVIALQATDDPVQGDPAWTGRGVEGEPWEVITQGVYDPDGVTLTWSYQWQRGITTDSGVVWENVADAVGTTYLPQAADWGCALRVQVTATDPIYQSSKTWDLTVIDHLADADAPVVAEGDIHIVGGPQKDIAVLEVGNPLGFDIKPKLAVLSHGGGVVVWYGQNTNGTDCTYAQIFNAAGQPTGDRIEIEMLGMVDSGDFEPQVTALGKDGRFVVAWCASDRADGRFDVFVQRFDAQGQALEDAVKLDPNASNRGDNLRPRIAVLDDEGRFVVTWFADDIGEIFDRSVYVQTFDAAGVPQGSSVHLEPPGVNNGDDFDPQVAALGQGHFVLTWMGADSHGDRSIFVQRMTADGQPLGETVQLEPLNKTDGVDSSPQVLALGDEGRFVVAWHGQDSGRDFSVFVQSFAADGTPSGEQVKLEALNASNGSDFVPQMAALGDEGRFVVTWYGQDFMSPRDFSVYVQSFDAMGRPSADMVMLEAPGVLNGQDLYPNVVALDQTGRFVVTWYGQDSSAINDYSIFVQVFDANGQPSGELLQLEPPNVTDGEDYFAEVAAWGDGGFVVTWSGQNGDPEGDNSVYVQSFDAEGQPVNQAYASGEVVMVAYDPTTNTDLASVSADFSALGGPAAVAAELQTTGPHAGWWVATYTVPENHLPHSKAQVRLTVTDTSGNATTVTDGAYLSLQPVALDLGEWGRLLAPVQEQGQWHYWWDRNGDGVISTDVSLDGGLFASDVSTSEELQALFGDDQTVIVGNVELHLPTLIDDQFVKVHVSAVL